MSAAALSKCAHGTLPVPAPATLALLGDAPVYAAGPPMERVTPTGAAILRMLECGVRAAAGHARPVLGYGAGGRDTPGEPNLLRLLDRRSRRAAAPRNRAEPIAVIETVIDDSTPQLLAYVSDLLLEAGAWDVYRVPVQMKKGRTGVQLTVLCQSRSRSALRDLLFRETTTIGLHWRIENKVALAREFQRSRRPSGARCTSKLLAGLRAKSPMPHQSTKIAARSPRATFRAAETGHAG